MNSLQVTTKITYTCAFETIYHFRISYEEYRYETRCLYRARGMRCPILDMQVRFAQFDTISSYLCANVTLNIHLYLYKISRLQR